MVWCNKLLNEKIHLPMKQLVILCSTLLCLFLSTTSSAQSGSVPAGAKKPGKYRQLFFLPQAQLVNSVMYKLDTVVTLNRDSLSQIRVTILGQRSGDEFTVMVSEETRLRKTIMQQTFFMNGWKSDGMSLNTWFTNDETKIRKELDDFLYIYFGIKLQSRKDFLKSLVSGDF